MPEQVYRPARRSLRTGGAGGRRLRLGHGLPRHRLHRAASAARRPARRSGPTGWARAPGGIANLAVAARRLGLRTSLAAAFGDDDYGDFCWRDPGGAGAHRPQPLAPLRGLALAGDRLDGRRPGPRAWSPTGTTRPCRPTELIGRPPALPRGDASTSATDAAARRRTSPTWVELARDDGALVFADVGWDPTGALVPRGARPARRSATRSCPTPVEAMAYTRTDTPHDALYALADLVPLAVVTNGANGAMAIDSTTGEEAVGAGAAGLGARPDRGRRRLRGRHGRRHARRLAAAAPAGVRRALLGAWRCSSSAARWPLPAGATSPTGGTACAARPSGGSYHRSLLRRYAFLDDLVPDVPLGAVRRAAATIARHADVEVTRDPIGTDHHDGG